MQRMYLLFITLSMLRVLATSSAFTTLIDLRSCGNGRARLINHTASTQPSIIKDYGRNIISKTLLHGVLSKSIIMNSSRKRSSISQSERSSEPPFLTKNYLSGAIDEALYRQQIALDSIERNTKNIDELNRSNKSNDEEKESRIEKRLLHLQQTMTKLIRLKKELEETKQNQSELQLIADNLRTMGFAKILSQSSDNWKSRQDAKKEFGRPQGFEGPLFYSSLGVPILVGRMKAHKDDILRRAAQGSDLWFQVEDYNGSRVLLRSSLVPSAKHSKKCKQMAADIAATFSDWSDEFEDIPVMYTDSRKVAKRGGQAGKMKQKKSIGTIIGRPASVADITKDIKL